MSLSEITDSVLKLSKLRIEIIMFLIIISSIFIFIDIFVYHNDINIGMITFDEIRAIWYILFFVSLIAYGIQKIFNNIKRQEYFNIMDSLDSEHLEILKSFADANSNTAEIKNNGDILMSLSQSGFEIDNIGKLYWSNPVVINGDVCIDVMSKVKLINDDTLPYIKAYFKKKKKS